jgi:hypothetical protein
MKKQTAVEWLYERFLFAGFATNSMWKEKAKEMEKNQIKDAYESGVWDVGCRNSDSKKYYNETYKDK